MTKFLPILALAALPVTAQQRIDYHAWQRPFLAYQQDTAVWIAVYISPEGQAYEHRNAAGQMLNVQARVAGECFQSPNGVEFYPRDCALFERVDAVFRDAVEAWARQNERKRT